MAHHLAHHPFLRGALAGALLAACTLTMAQPSPAHGAKTRYEHERQQCLHHNTQDSLATCLREAGAAQDAARQGQLSAPGPDAAHNATQRCEVFDKADERADCIRRVQNPAVGSVSGGGVLRESVTTTIVPQ
jgi:hypothetical protein